MSRTLQTLARMASIGIILAATGQVLAGAMEEHQNAQNKLMAARSARVEAMRRLSERINGLLITSETYVRDFVAANDSIRSEMASWLSGMKEVGDPTYTPDGVCQVTLEVTVREVVVQLKRLHKEYYKGDKVRYEDIDQIIAHTKDTTLRETGQGIPGAFVPRGVPASGQDIMSAKAWEYWKSHCTVQGRLLAERAARVEALRRLNTSMQAFLQGSYRVNGSEKVLPDGTVEVTVEIDVKPLWNMVLFYQEKLDLQVR